MPQNERTYIAIDLKSYYASVECMERGLDPMQTNLVVADPSRTEKTICLAVSPALKAYGIPCLKNYPGDGQFGKIMLGMSGYGVEILVPETLLADAQALQEGCAEALTEGDDNA